MLTNPTGARLAARFDPPEIRTEPRGLSATTVSPSMPAPRASTAPAKPAASAPVGLTGFSQVDLDRAVAKARADERARIATVFASSASHGRERACATLLTSHSNFSGAAIAKELAHLPTDAELDREKRQARADTASAVWDHAIAANGYVKPVAAEQSPVARSAASDAWERAIASISKQGVY